MTSSKIFILGVIVARVLFVSVITVDKIFKGGDFLLEFI